MGFNIEIVHKPGKENRAADGLSRLPQTPECTAISVAGGMNLKLILDQRQIDPTSVAMRNKLNEGTEAPVGLL